MPITSTVPGAVQQLAAYMTAVATGNPALNAGVYVAGVPTSSVQNNFMMVGSYEGGILIQPETYKWNAIPGTAMLRGEEYAVQGCIRSWSGDAGPESALRRLDEAFAMLNGLHQQISEDPSGSGNLSPSGSWGDLDVSMDINGPIGGKGWGVVLSFELHVINAQLSNTDQFV